MQAPAITAFLPATLEAGAEIMRIYESGETATEIKDGGSPVTAADKAAEAVILRHLAELAPGIPVVAEEEVAAGRIPETPAAFFLVDPLDGTKEFLNRNGEFTVNIALIVNAAPVAGIVYAPALGELCFGTTGEGAECALVRDGVLADRRSVRVRAPSAEGPLALASRSHRSPETDAFLDRAGVSGIVSAGSSLKFCRIAAGEADLYPRLAPTMEWDTAAGDAVLRAAGGRTVTLDGAPLRYGKRGRADAADFLNPWFVASGAVVDPEILSAAGA
ncbi:3'(2'),5'-bisphosphate nucleotidase CysQ [Amorphus orientalis]|uniref:3'(2'),5'-bisphosphate nucleotidase CysQ n=1 Tax=Amorphus orientalis TaxID=649198 RepID=A0AAE4AST4_9HYPH|nr:3'(2'),5'-bisphosphate nucleotidase CysQ [Amorphus orientalis]MDQ0315330.1 3'(2'),5'-bisphosphate nucleotidase [Amorphus orientalis]